jgi:hypothetical protein
MHFLEKLLRETFLLGTDQGLIVKRTMLGASARELNRDLFTALRRAGRKTQMRSELLFNEWHK